MRGALRGLPVISFKAIREELYERSFTLYHPASMVNRSLSVNSQFCQAVVHAGYLSFRQMVNATIRYRLGASKNGGVIFWQIDHEGRPHDGKIMYYQPDCHRIKDKNATWVSYLLARREGRKKGEYTTSHCFFGLHLLLGDKETRSSWTSQAAKPSSRSADITPIAIVEAEKTAVILSEHYPQYIWLAAGGLYELNVDKFRPLRGRKVVLFPDTDPDGAYFKRWSDIANQVMAASFWEGSPPIRVSPILEQHATIAQKQSKIDLVDFLFAEGPA